MKLSYTKLIMVGIKTAKVASARVRIKRACGILKGKKSLVKALLRQRAEDKKKEDAKRIR